MSQAAFTCLFWNFRCSDPKQEEIAGRVALHHGVDLLVLAESKEVDSERLLEVLNRSSLVPYEHPPDQHERFKVFTRFPGGHFPSVYTMPRMDVRRLRRPGVKEILIAVVHFIDRRNHDPDEQHANVHPLNLALREAEFDAGHTRTVVVGDFNMNPFEKGMVDPENGFGAMMTRELARRHSGLGVQDPQRFYNPSWAKLGHELPEPPGTFYWDQKRLLNFYWHTLDQVLIRPALFESFRDEALRVLNSIPSQDGSAMDLIRSKEKHWEFTVSDHLPILFKLSLPEGGHHVEGY